MLLENMIPNYTTFKTFLKGIHANIRITLNPNEDLKKSHNPYSL